MTCLGTKPFLGELQASMAATALREECRCTERCHEEIMNNSLGDRKFKVAEKPHMPHNIQGQHDTIPSVVYSAISIWNSQILYPSHTTAFMYSLGPGNALEILTDKHFSVRAPPL